MEAINTTLGSLSLNSTGAENESLPFRPNEPSTERIPRYLFRVFCRRSDGSTDSSWVRSYDAVNDIEKSKIDIFSSRRVRPEDMLRRHLRGWQIQNGRDEEEGDNLVSWTSSLLFALVYVFYRRHESIKNGDRLRLGEISLCIVDTPLLPEGTFLRDAELLNILDPPKVTGEPTSIRQLRSRVWYFGEYLSQGSLRIENKCGIVTAQQMIDGGLCRLRHDFDTWRESGSKEWAKAVVRIRDDITLRPSYPPGIDQEKIEAVLNITKLFDERWRLPIAINLLSIIPGSSKDHNVLQKLGSIHFTGPSMIPGATYFGLTDADNAREECSAKRTRIVLCDFMPELRQSAALFQNLHRDFYIRRAREEIGKTKISLALAKIYFKHSISLQEERLSTADEDNDILGPSYQNLLRLVGSVSLKQQALRVELTRFLGENETLDAVDQSVDIARPKMLLPKDRCRKPLHYLDLTSMIEPNTKSITNRNVSFHKTTLPSTPK